MSTGKRAKNKSVTADSVQPKKVKVLDKAVPKKAVKASKPTDAPSTPAAADVEDVVEFNAGFCFDVDNSDLVLSKAAQRATLPVSLPTTQSMQDKVSRREKFDERIKEVATKRKKPEEPKPDDDQDDDAVLEESTSATKEEDQGSEEEEEDFTSAADEDEDEDGIELLDQDENQPRFDKSARVLEEAEVARMTFDDLKLSRPLLKGVSALGFTRPTRIQASTIPWALQGRDICGGAVTGSGKTLAFLLPVIERLQYRQKSVAATRVLILLPTRELAV